MSLTDTPIGFAVTDATSQAPLIYVGQTTALSLAIVNNSGADIALSDGGAQASAFGFYPPQGFFTPDELCGFALALPGWSGAPDKAAGAFNIGCSQAGTWKSGATLTFTLTNVTSAGPAATGTATVVPANLGDDMPFSLTAPLAVATAPKKGNLSLPDVLDVGLDSQGTVYRSVSTDPLTNKLFLTLKNTGATALSTETDKQPGNPQVFVSFVYGNTSGALAPDDYDPKKVPPVGSAWNIGIDSQSLQAPWGGTKPVWSQNLPHPTWTLAPDPTNHFILGPAQSDAANVTFAFTDIVSLTPVGHTQMLVLCTGFAKDAETKYDDHLFVLDIAKLDPPPTRGLLSFAGMNPVIAVTDPAQKVKIDLRWAMFDVARVQLLTSSPSIAPWPKKYPAPQPLDYDGHPIHLPPLSESEAIFTTLQAFDGNGGYLNSLQFTTYAQLSYVMDPSKKVYPIALIGDTFWLMANYDFAGQGDVYFYDDDPAFEPTYGRLYDLDAALANPPSGWELPSADDWKALVAAYSGGAVPPYTKLIAGGSSGFAAQLGGWRTVNPDGSHAYANGPGNPPLDGFYWAAPGSASPMCAQFSAGAQRVGVIPVSDRTTAMSVRYVRHA
jgi:uncharacterized protein (TIGR02145 family)